MGAGAAATGGSAGAAGAGSGGSAADAGSGGSATGAGSCAHGGDCAWACAEITGASGHAGIGGEGLAERSGPLWESVPAASEVRPGSAAGAVSGGALPPPTGPLPTRPLPTGPALWRPLRGQLPGSSDGHDVRANGMPKPSWPFGSGTKSCETSSARGSDTPSRAGKAQSGRCSAEGTGSSSTGGGMSGSGSGSGAWRRLGHERPWRGPDRSGRGAERPDRGTFASGPAVARSCTGTCADSNCGDETCSAGTGALTWTAVTCPVRTGRAAAGEIARCEPAGFLAVITCRPARPDRTLPVFGVFGRLRGGGLRHTRTETEISDFSEHGAIRHQVRGSDK